MTLGHDMRAKQPSLSLGVPLQMVPSLGGKGQGAAASPTGTPAPGPGKGPEGAELHALSSLGVTSSDKQVSAVHLPSWCLVSGGGGKEPTGAVRLPRRLSSRHQWAHSHHHGGSAGWPMGRCTGGMC